MSKIIKTAALLVLLAAAGCKEFPNPFDGDRVLAKAGKESLSVTDVEKVFPTGIAGADSVAWVESYVDRWVRDNLKLQEAERLFGDDAADEELVQRYRNSLATRKLEQYFINSMAGDSLCTEDELRKYYDEHRSDFVLDRSIVKGRVVAFPTSFRQKARLRELLESQPGSDSRLELEAMLSKNGFAFRETGGWMEYSEFLALLPTRRNEKYDDLLTRRGIQEMTDGGTTYLFSIPEARTPGMTSPYEMVSDVVRWTVTSRRRAEIIRAAEDSLYRRALAEEEASVNL
ncbi:MAG: hypothetical protein LBV18_07225 [Alistipes sp.]|jgi:hypothetical protein|nr:hypothetical protein [Alistipes sp.]